MMYRSLLVLLMFALVHSTSEAQQRGIKRPKSTMAASMDRIYAEAIVVPMEQSDSADVYVEVRYTIGSLAFTKVNSMQEVRGNYSASITLSVEARDAIGVVRQRVRFSDTAFVNSFDDAQEKSLFRRGSVALSLGPGTYVITLEPSATKDNGLKRISLPKLTISKKGQRASNALPCFFSSPVGTTYDTLRPYIFSGNLPFPVSKTLLVATLPYNVEQLYDVWIRQQEYEQGDIRWWSGVDIHANASATTKRLRKIDDERWVVDENATHESRLLVIPLDAKEFVPGRYELKLVGSVNKDTLRYPFRVEWESMPISLRTLSYALDALAYICPEDVLDSLREGDEADQRIHLMEWWRRQDPTLGTAHNERMMEYYQRVDRAYSEYSTLQEPDGVFTDRGKIYILYGAPTKIDRKVSKSGESSETWIYTNKVRKFFVFAIKEAGQYRLTNIQPLR